MDDPSIYYTLHQHEQKLVVYQIQWIYAMNLITQCKRFSINPAGNWPAPDLVLRTCMHIPSLAARTRLITGDVTWPGVRALFGGRLKSGAVKSGAVIYSGTRRVKYPKSGETQGRLGAERILQSWLY